MEKEPIKMFKFLNAEFFGFFSVHLTLHTKNFYFLVCVMKIMNSFSFAVGHVLDSHDIIYSL